MLGRIFDESLLRDSTYWPFTLTRVEGHDQPFVQIGFESSKQSVPVEKVLSELLRGILVESTRLGHGGPFKSVFSVPLYYKGSQLQALRSAAISAGMNDVQFVWEPYAVVKAYQFDQGYRSHSSTNIVFDIGGGSLDISVVRVNEEVCVFSICVFF